MKCKIFKDFQLLESIKSIQLFERSMITIEVYFAYGHFWLGNLSQNQRPLLLFVLYRMFLLRSIRLLVRSIGKH